MICVHFYDEVTGLIRPGTKRASVITDEFISANTPKGCKPILGVKNARCQRVDVETGKLIAYFPLRPDTDHEWSGSSWVKRPEIAEKDRRIRAAKRRMALLEVEIQKPRRLREAILDESGGKAKLAELSAQISELRQIINS